MVSPSKARVDHYQNALKNDYLIPLLSDVFFTNMAITIMTGLDFATLLTLIFVPVLYSIFHQIKTAEFRTG